MNLTDHYHMLNKREKEKIVFWWNRAKRSKITIATLPFINAVEFKRLMYDITNGTSSKKTEIKLEFKYEQNIKKVIYLATKDVPWDTWAFGEEVK